MKVFVASNLNSNHPMQKGWSGGTMEFEPQAKTNLVGGQKCAMWGVRVESLVMSICKCLDLVSNQRGWPKVITWY